MTATQREQVIAGLVDDRERLLAELDTMPNAAVGTPRWDARIEKLQVIKAAMVGLGVEPGRMPAYDLALAFSAN